MGKGECEQCPRGKYSSQTRAVSETACLACSDHSFTQMAGSSDASSCVCNAGYTGGVDEGVCSACRVGTYKAVNGSTECDMCPYGTYSTMEGAVDAGTCTACPGLHFAERGSSGPWNCTPPETVDLYAETLGLSLIHI